MYNPDEIIVELTKYIKKLNKIIMQEADFTFWGKRYVKKRRIDDILCCIEAILPNAYRDDKNRIYKGMAIYRQITSTIRVKSLLSKDLYSIDYSQVSVYFNKFIKAVQSDINNLNNIS